MTTPSGNVPCQDPDRCGVKTHRAGTVSDCMRSGKQGSKQSASALSSTPKLASPSTPEPDELSEMAQKALDENEFAEKYFKNNIVGQYLDQVLQGKGVDQLDEVTHTDYCGGDNQIGLVFGVWDEDEMEDWEVYEPVLEELERHGSAEALDWIKSNAGSTEFARYVSARGFYQSKMNELRAERAGGGRVEDLELSWAEGPLEFQDKYE